MKIPLTTAGIEAATFRFVAQHLNHCATADYQKDKYKLTIKRIITQSAAHSTSRDRHLDTEVKKPVSHVILLAQPVTQYATQ